MSIGTTPQRVIALYFCKADIERADVINCVTAFSAQTEFQPTLIERREIGEAKFRRRRVTARTWHSALTLTLDSASLLSIVQPNEKGEFIHPCSQVMIDFDEGRLSFQAPEDLFPFSFAKELAKELTRAGAPRYGFSRVLDRSAAGFFVGGVSSGDSLNDRDRVQLRSIWIMTHKPEYIDRGLVVDVFDMNILSRSHLDQYIETECIADWIVGESIGELEYIDSDHALWTIPESMISIARTELCNNGVIMKFN